MQSNPGRAQSDGQMGIAALRCAGAPGSAGSPRGKPSSCPQPPVPGSLGGLRQLLARRHNNSQLADGLSPLPEPRSPLASPVSYVARRSAFFNR